MLTDTILRNRYKILKELGRGGFSVTYLAIDMDLPGNPKCVVKQLKTRQSNNTILQIAKKLFDREAQVLYRLGKGHKQIPEMLAHFEENDEFYLVQEFVDGHDLSKEIKLRHRLSEEKVIKLLQEILEVLSFVHENNVIHRDIKLRNIMRRREDGKIVLIDFGAVKEIKGLAKNQQGDVNSTLIIGTPGYMPDEQANGKPRLCSDVYAVGMLGIQALTGISPRELPFLPHNGELIWRDSANVSNKLAEVLTGMVRHHFSQRYQTAAEALEALKSPVLLLPNAYSAYDLLPETLPSTIRKSGSPIVQTLGFLGLMGVGFGLGVFGWSFFQSSFNGNEAVINTTEVPDNTLKNLKTYKKPKITNNSNPKIFLPSTPRILIDSKNKPIFEPFILLKENHIQVTSQTPKSKSKKSQNIQVKSISNFKSKPKPTSPETKFTPKQSIIKGEKEVNTAPLIPQSQNEADSLPSSLISPSKDKEIEKSQTSLPSQALKEEKQKQNLESLTPSPTASPTEEKQNEIKEENEVKQEKQKQNLESLTPSPTASPTEEKQNEIKEDKEDKQKQDLESPTPSPTPSPTEEKQKEKSEEQQNPTSTLPDTPAIESQATSPKPSLSPTPTEDRVIVPTDTSSKTPVEGNSYFITIPTLPTPTTEVEIQPTYSPQPTPTPDIEIQSTTSPQLTPTTEVEIESTYSPQPTPTPEIQIQSTYSPQPTPTPEAKIQVTPQASVTPIPEAEIKPTYSPQPTPTPEVKIKPTYSPQTTPTPEIEIEVKIEVTPQALATPTPQTTKKESTPPQEQGLSLKGFAI